MRVVGWAVAWGLIGLVGGYGAALGLGILAFDLFNVSQREGAAAMGLAFVIAPAVAVVTAVAAAVIATVVTRRRMRTN